jgi:hypothetical protein
VLKPAIVLVFSCAIAAAAQQEAAQPGGKPQIKVNYLNVCAPSPEEQAVLKAALAKIQVKPQFARDFEISRGETTLKDAPEAKFVRLRRDFVAESPLMTAQYSISSDTTSTIEIMVLRLRDYKEFHEVSLEDRASTDAAPAAAMLAVDTPVARIRVERLGKSSVVLTRCQNADQNAYEPLFRQASELMAQYRKALDLSTMLRSEIAWLSGSGRPATSAPK